MAGSILQGKHVTLVVTGGIAAYKACELVRLLKKSGCDVNVVMSEAATKFVGPVTFEALSGHPVALDMFDGTMPHLALTRGKTDLLVVAPATANIIAKAACGIADDLASTVILGRDCPLLVCPAMNNRMFEAAPTQRNIKTLAEDGAIIVGPEYGDLACGVKAGGRMSEPAKILAAIESALSEKILAGKKVLVTAGPTVEKIDPVRAITNFSSGKQGYAVARAAAMAGAEVTLVSGPTNLPCPEGVARINVTSAREMHAAVHENIAGCDAFIAVAAVADWRVENESAVKIKKTADSSGFENLTFVENPDILKSVAALENNPYVVGFAAETNDIIENAKAKCIRKGADMIVANAAVATFGSDSNKVAFVTSETVTEYESKSKAEVAKLIIRHVADNLS